MSPVPKKMSHLTGSQPGQQWWGKVWDNRGKCCCIHTANYYRCLKLVKLFWLFLKQEIKERWPTGNVPQTQKETAFVLHSDSSQIFCKGTVVIKKSWKTSLLTPTEKYIPKTRETKTSETMFLQIIRCTAARKHKQTLKSTLKKCGLEKFQKPNFTPVTQAPCRENSDYI